MVCAALLLAGCKGEAPAPDDTRRPVRTQVLQPSQISMIGIFPGEIRPHRESLLGFQVGGKLIERRVQLGDPVKRNQVLARIDPSDLGLAENAARAELAAAEADRIRLAADLARYTKLYEAGFISRAELDQRRAAHKAAAARSAQAAAGLQVRSNQSEYAELRASADGVVTGVEAEAGQVVAAGQVVMRVASSTAKEVAFSIPEGRLDAVREHGSATVTLWTGGPELEATVTEIAASADPATRAFAARARLQNAPASVQYGMTATVRFAVPLERPMYRVPLSALLRDGDGDGTAVWVLDPQSLAVHRQAVTVATVTDTDVVLESSLPPGVEVVTAGVHLLREGQSVKRLNEAVAAPAPSAPATAAMLPLQQAAPGAGN